MDKVTIRALVIVVVFSFLVLTPWPARAQTVLEPTQLVIGAPAQAKLGEPLTVQALLVDSHGHPISKALIYFTTQAKFLSDRSNVVLAEAVTNANGQAVAHFAVDLSGNLALRAEFRGDTEYAPSNATAQLAAAGAGSVYSEHVGVDLPGFNVPPVSAPKASLQSPQQGIARFVQSLWPAMNGWPIAAVLFLVWSMYLLAVRYVFRVAGLGSEPEELSTLDSRRSL